MAMDQKVHDYLMLYSTLALANTPVLLDQLLRGYKADDPIWDYRPSPERFTLREAIAHVADWNSIYCERIETALKEDNPMLPNADEEQIAIDRCYSTSNPVENLACFMRTRHQLVDLVKTIKPTDWDRMAVREGLGQVSLDQQIMIVMGHDAYHTKQVMDYLAANQ